MWKISRIRCGEETSKSAVLFCPSVCLEDLGKIMEVLSYDTWLLGKGKSKAAHYRPGAAQKVPGS